jgi:hypothetical protein
MSIIVLCASCRPKIHGELGRVADPCDDIAEVFHRCGEGPDRLIVAAVGYHFARDSRRLGVRGLSGGCWLPRPSGRTADTLLPGPNRRLANTESTFIPVQPAPPRPMGVSKSVMPPAMSGLERATVNRRNRNPACSPRQRPLQRPMQPDGGIASRRVGLASHRWAGSTGCICRGVRHRHLSYATAWADGIRHCGLSLIARLPPRAPQPPVINPCAATPLGRPGRRLRPDESTPGCCQAIRQPPLSWKLPAIHACGDRGRYYYLIRLRS